MLGTLIFSALAAYTTLGVGNAIDKLGKKSSCSSSKPNFLYGEYGEEYNEPINPTSPHNSISEIIRGEDKLFYVTIENTVTGDKKTLSSWNKWLLCLDADEVAFDFAIKEREEYHTC